MLEPDWRQPDPPGMKPVRARNPWLPVIVLGVVLVLVIVAVFVPIPVFWMQIPGVVRDVETLVEIEGATDYTSEGSLYLTTVSFDDHVTFADWVKTSFNDETVVVFKDDITGGGTEEELIEAARAQMRDSKLAARDVALAELGLLRPSARITRVAPDSPAEGSIEVGDVVLSVSGLPTYTVCDVSSEIRKKEIGEETEIAILRDGRRRVVTVETDSLDPAQPEIPMVGIVMEQRDPLAPGAPDVTIDTGEIGGPSAGLIFSLAIYDRLTPDDITHGREIAGTGVIRCDGTVDPIGGVEQKVAAAEEKGAEIFLAPADNFEAAQGVAEDIEVVSVATFDDAVEYLADLD